MQPLPSILKAVSKGLNMKAINVLIVAVLTALLTTSVYYFNNEVPGIWDLSAIIFIMAIISVEIVGWFEKPKS